MLVIISGTKYSGIGIAVDTLVKEHGFQRIHENASEDELIDYVTKNYTKDLVMDCTSLSLIEKLDRRPSAVHFSLDAPIAIKMKIFQQMAPGKDLDQFFAEMDSYDFNPNSIELRERSHIRIKCMNKDTANYQSRISDAITQQLASLREPDNAFSPPLRPSWDTYFMKLATLAASRSNCMKRKVGCVIVRDRRVIATGYNGTPRHLTNCFNGGCPRCNDGDSQNLHTCLCLHAEENALLEAGRDRVGANATLYCDTCPCLTCSVKLVQTGITEVIYSQSYRMDEASFKVLISAGIRVRQFSFVKEPKLIMI
ncbi:deoxycytidine monophosphate (dCMP) deaminase [Zygosaccharomyces mellis]|uniref:Deoxycytidylate deaminase n=1 Tax=Zygosaccharomyces mellis TaxID=42258 RepID=A0A4C2EBU7_9SACH|nr:deoxycytidine monophosphate (dCMP) deaminase [Zygosaccharomyces mellis]